MTDNSILTNDQILHKTRRIAYQILENNVDEKEVVLAGICGNGYTFAMRIQKMLHEISDLKTTLCEVRVRCTVAYRRHCFNTEEESIEKSGKPDTAVEILV